MSGKRIMKLASRSKRFGAGMIDALVPMAAYLVFTVVLAVNGIRHSPYNGFGYGYGYGYGFDMGYNYGSRLSGASAAAIVITFLLLIVYIIVEFVFYAKGKSIGKAALGLQVVSSSDGRPFGFWKMVLREMIVKQASGVFLLGFIWILIDEKNRGWHDKILDSYVVDLKESEKMNRRKKHESAIEEELAHVAAKPKTDGPAVEPKIEEPAAEPKASGLPEEIKTEAPKAAEPAAEPNAAETETEALAVEPEIEIETIAIPEAAEVMESIAEEAVETAAAPAVSMSMKKEELLEAAREAGVKVGSRATKAEIIEAIKNASENK